MAMASCGLATATTPQTASRLCTVNVENLRARAERMVTRLGGRQEMSDRRVTEMDARLSDGSAVSLPSRQCRFKPADVDALVASVQRGDTDLRLGRGDDEVWIDFRWLHPADDDRVARALGA